MPTTKPRHTLTETDELAAALRDAARVWPHDATSSPKLLLHLIKEGRAAIEPEAERRRQQRRIALEEARAKLAGTYPPGYLRELRDEWPD